MKILTKAKKFFLRPKPKLQEELLKQAILEEGLKVSSELIRIDHDLGKSYILKHQLGIIYPRSFIGDTDYKNTEKKIKYYFNGFEGGDGGRICLLEKYNDPCNEIIFTREGRKKRKLFNYNYYNSFMKAKYGLCPHQLDWKGDLNALWTYRFIESCMVGAIPILFRKTPLCSQFVRGFNYFWDDELHEYDEAKAAENRILAIERHTLIGLEGKKLKNFLKKI